MNLTKIAIENNRATIMMLMVFIDPVRLFIPFVVYQH